MKQIAVSAPLLSSLSKQDSVSAPDHLSYCTIRAGLLYDFYRKGEAAKPQTFIAGVAAVLAEYPLDIVDYVTDARTGFPSNQKWPPEIYEIREACDDLRQERQRRAERDIQLQAQFAIRAQLEREEDDRPNRPTLAELKAQGVIIDKPEGPRLPPETLWERHCRHRANLPGIKASAETRAILEAAGYDVDGPDDQQPQGVAA